MRFLTSFLFLFFVLSAKGQKVELNEAVEFLNQLRANPTSFSKEVGVSLAGIEKREGLNWDETLAKVAQAKA